MAWNEHDDTPELRKAINELHWALGDGYPNQQVDAIDALIVLRMEMLEAKFKGAGMADETPPDDPPQWAMKAAQDLWFEQLNFANDRMGALPIVARALLKAREEAFEEAATLADGFAADAQTTNRSPHRVAEEIASAIRQHSQKGER